MPTLPEYHKPSPSDLYYASLPVREKLNFPEYLFPLPLLITGGIIDVEYPPRSREPDTTPSD